MSKSETLKSGALYIRVSTHGKQEELSPDAQKRLLLKYAKDHNIVVSKSYIYEENGISGRKADRRPEFMRMISTAKSNPSPFDVILVWKFSRFARNQEESIVYKSLLRRKCNVDVISVSEPLIEGPFGSLIERIIEWMDEYYSIRLSDEVFRGMSEKAMKGGYQARPPLGYKIAVKGEPPVIVPEEAKVVEYIFNKYVNERCGIFDIARSLNVIGAKTSQGKAFGRRSVEYILQNPTYCGKIRWNRTTNATNEIKPKEEWIITQGTHPAIISEELFNAAQERYKAEYHPRGARPSSTYKHWLSGLVKCPACGSTMVASNTNEDKNKKRYCYFVCHRYSKGKCVGKSIVSARKLEPAVLEGIKAATTATNLSFSIKAPIPVENKGELKILQDLLAKLESKEKRIKEAYMNEIDTLEEYKENKLLLAKERADLEEKIKNTTSAQTDSTEEIKKDMQERIKNVYDIVTSDSFTSQQKNDAIKSIVEKIIYKKDEKMVEIYYYYI